MDEYIVLFCVCLLSAGIFTGIGIAAIHSKAPFSFWANEPIDPTSIADISAYNRESGRMWLLYAAPWWVCVILALIAWILAANWIAFLILAFMVLACTLGIYWLVKTYEGIRDRYSAKKT